MNVCTTGMPWPRASARSSSEARPRMTPLPAKISGNDAASISRAAVSSARWSGDGRRVRSAESAAPSADSSATSSGTSTWQAPGFSDSASLKALRMISGITAPVSTRVFHFVNGRRCSTMSMYSSPGRPNTYWTPSFSRHLTIRSDAFTALGDPDRLDVHELPDAVFGQLATVAGALDPTERHAGIRLHDAIHEHRARLDLRGQALGPRPILRPHRRAQAEL